MKNLKLLILLFTIYSLLFTKFIFANLPVNDYLYQYEKYSEVYQDFIDTRDKYLKYQTLTAKDKAIEAVKSIISRRNLVLRTYFLALKWKLKTAPSVVGIDQRAKLMSRLDKEINWLENQEIQLQNGFNYDLEDLFIISDRVETKEGKLKSISYQSLSAILLGETRNLYSQSVAITNFLSSEVKEKQATKSAELKDWLREIENKNYLAQKEIEAADNKLEEIEKNDKETQIIPLYKAIQTKCEKAKNYLNSALIFQKEVYSAIVLKEKNGTKS